MWIRMTLVAALVGVSLTGCVTTHTCVSWVDFETPQDVYDDAGLVVRGTVDAVVGTRDVFGVDAPVHRVEVTEALGGEDPGSTLDVASTPLTCVGDAGDYPDGDPLDVDGEVILFLLNRDGGWRLITPTDGVLPYPADGELPFDTD